MEIYAVEEGDTIYSIADKYGVSAQKLIQDNGLSNPDKLVIGQTIVIAYPKQTYLVEDGDTLESIAYNNNVPLMQLLRNNPFLADRMVIYPGEELVISYDTNGTITTNGIVYPFINRNSLIQVLPFLTYLSVFNYKAAERGNITSYYDDTEVIQISKDYGTIPLMLLSTLTLLGTSDIEIGYSIAFNEENQDRLIENILNIIKAKGYSGINMVFNFINTSNQVTYKNFMRKVSSRVTQEGYLYFATINPSLENVEKEASLMNIDYTGMSDTVNGIIFLKYVWGTNYDPPSPVINIYNIRELLDYFVTMLPADKIVIGAPVISYDWTLPYISGKSGANSLSLESALNLALSEDVIIQFDDISQTPYFYYNQIIAGSLSSHIVWTLDARSINALVHTIKEYSSDGICILNSMIFYPQLWLVINSQYDIVKISLPY